MADDGVFRTDNQALAVTLALANYRYEIKLVTQRKALWHFPEPTDEADAERFDDMISDFEEWNARVEPRAFTLRWKEMREELFKVLPSRPATPAASI